MFLGYFQGVSGFFRVFSGCFSLCPFLVCPLGPFKIRFGENLGGWGTWGHWDVAPQPNLRNHPFEIVLFFSLTEAPLRPHPDPIQHPETSTRNGSETAPKRSQTEPKRTETEPKWTEIKLSGVGRPGVLSGWGGCGLQGKKKITTLRCFPHMSLPVVCRIFFCYRSQLPTSRSACVSLQVASFAIFLPMLCNPAKGPHNELPALLCLVSQQPPLSLQ